MSIAFFALAAIFNAVMDTLLWHFSKSVFNTLTPEWWNPNYSWMSVTPFLGIVRLDAWHLAKYGMMGSFCLAVVTYKPIFGFWDVIIYPFAWFFGFELFYSKLLIRKKIF